MGWDGMEWDGMGWDGKSVKNTDSEKANNKN